MTTYDDHAGKEDGPKEFWPKDGERPRDTEVLKRPKPMTFAEFFAKTADYAQGKYYTCEVSARQQDKETGSKVTVHWQIWLSCFGRHYEGYSPEEALALCAAGTQTTKPEDVDVGF